MAGSVCTVREQTHWSENGASSDYDYYTAQKCLIRISRDLKSAFPACNARSVRATTALKLQKKRVSIRAIQIAGNFVSLFDETIEEGPCRVSYGE